ncbi:hypothetical protein LPJ59_006091 [Coemansia sp. RSA 2399]|nr:hypothetical protein LPJ59_006091 [Coemansia sp. RSA 2399]KAJ1889971.1 hypothetical protein LPJ81_006024 [Coemansia sp. IMI 209127]
MEFSQRPAHPAIPGAHRMMAAPAPVPAHYQYVPDAPQPHYTHPSTDTMYSPAPCRLPSVSELLVSQKYSSSQHHQAADTTPVHTAALYAQHPDHQAQIIHPQHAAYTSPPLYAMEPQKPLGIDVPKPIAASHHRDSESASSVSSQATLVGSFSPQQPRQTPGFKQQIGGVYEDDVFTAASILMSLRTCKMPC